MYYVGTHTGVTNLLRGIYRRPVWTVLCITEFYRPLSSCFHVSTGYATGTQHEQRVRVSYQTFFDDECLRMLSHNLITNSGFVFHWSALQIIDTIIMYTGVILLFGMPCAEINILHVYLFPIRSMRRLLFKNRN